ncbi:hypothetical protein AN640_01295 [Candidatus Epulonipiscium fishelsonii]|uniref:Uncharacterized protein n=1 Tax=Candidatus Epulonipiscium fishelsonii TaxID=77094 RepID=A0ACC8XG28_9FIRM|nr:hypothetical protein AN640_01295 [Epulopiscium sp. SCG-D08WGA-EpuloA1]
MLENILMGLVNTFSPINLTLCILGVAIGIVFGALPGFSATMGVAVFVPFSYVLQPQGALLLLSGIYCGGVYGGCIPAVLLGIPGTPASAPTAFEGRALTANGESGKALMLATLGSTIGGVVSSIALLLFAPVLALIAMEVGAPEQVMIAIFGLSIVCMLSEGNMIKGMLVGAVSLLLATIGQDPVLGYPRYTFGMYQLIGGLSVVPVLIGLFSMPEVFAMLEQPLGKIAEVSAISKMKISIKDLTSNAVNSFRSAIIGVVIGIIPAAGPDIASFLAYNEAKKVSKKPEKFGNGSVEGIIAAESANNGVTGGSLIPLLTLAVPGSAPAAIFLGAMIIHGLRPGPLLFTQNAEDVYTLLVGFLVINILIFFIGCFFCKIAGKILLIPKTILAITIVVLSIVGSFSIQQNMFDVIVMFIAGIIGYIMTKNNFPLSPVALALLLGPMLEESLMLTGVMFDGNYLMMFTRPLTIIFAVLTLVSVVYPIIKNKFVNTKQ